MTVCVSVQPDQSVTANEGLYFLFSTQVPILFLYLFLKSITYESKEARHKSVGELTGGGLMQTTWLWFSSGDMVGLTLRDANRQSLARAALRGQG